MLQRMPEVTKNQKYRYGSSRPQRINSDTTPKFDTRSKDLFVQSPLSVLRVEKQATTLCGNESRKQHKPQSALDSHE